LLYKENEVKIFIYFIRLGVITITRPIGPNFVSIITTKQRLYYNNLGTRLDCTASGTPSPVLTWFRTNGSDDRPSTIVRSSELMWEILSCFFSYSQLLAIDHSTGISCRLLGGKLKGIFIYIYTYIYIFAIERNGNSFLIIIRHLSNRLINIDDHLTRKNTSLFYWI
jgi:hypothetical protein